MQQVKTNSPNYIPSFDLARFLCALIICCWHHFPSLFLCMPYGGTDRITQLLCEEGKLGVELFFAISGYLFAATGEQRLLSGQYTAGSFLLSRIRRIWPTMVAALLLTALGQWTTCLTFGTYLIINDARRNSFPAFLFGLLGIQSGWFAQYEYDMNGPAWYICVLMICYLFCLLILRLAGRRNAIRYLMYGTMILFGILCCLMDRSIPLCYSINGRGYICFYSGVLIAALHAKRSEASGKKSPVISMLCLIVLLVYAFLCASGRLSQPELIFAVIAVPSIMGLLLNGVLLHILSDNRIIHSLGAISFDMLLLNFPLAIWINYFVSLLHLPVSFASAGFYLFFVVMTFLTAAGFHALIGYITALFTRRSANKCKPK